MNTHNCCIIIYYKILIDYSIMYTRILLIVVCFFAAYWFGIKHITSFCVFNCLTILSTDDRVNIARLWSSFLVYDGKTYIIIDRQNRRFRAYATEHQTSGLRLQIDTRNLVYQFFNNLSTLIKDLCNVPQYE
jgi:hypothetical protein